MRLPVFKRASLPALNYDELVEQARARAFEDAVPECMRPKNLGKTDPEVPLGPLLSGYSIDWTRGGTSIVGTGNGPEL